MAICHGSADSWTASPWSKSNHIHYSGSTLVLDISIPLAVQQWQHLFLRNSGRCQGSLSGWQPSAESEAANGWWKFAVKFAFPLKVRGRCAIKSWDTPYALLVLGTTFKLQDKHQAWQNNIHNVRCQGLILKCRDKRKWMHWGKKNLSWDEFQRLLLFLIYPRRFQAPWVMPIIKGPQMWMWPLSRYLLEIVTKCLSPHPVLSYMLKAWKRNRISFFHLFWNTETVRIK